MKLLNSQSLARYQRGLRGNFTFAEMTSELSDFSSGGHLGDPGTVRDTAHLRVLSQRGKKPCVLSHFTHKADETQSPIKGQNIATDKRSETFPETPSQFPSSLSAAVKVLQRSSSAWSISYSVHSSKVICNRPGLMQRSIIGQSSRFPVCDL